MLVHVTHIKRLLFFFLSLSLWRMDSSLFLLHLFFWGEISPHILYTLWDFTSCPILVEIDSGWSEWKLFVPKALSCTWSLFYPSTHSCRIQRSLSSYFFLARRVFTEASSAKEDSNTAPKTGILFPKDLLSALHCIHTDSLAPRWWNWRGGSFMNHFFSRICIRNWF